MADIRYEIKRGNKWIQCIKSSPQAARIADSVPTEKGKTMNIHDATEQAYKRGYEAGQPKWIPVSEPPKERGCYLVTVNHWLDGKPVAREAFWNYEDWLSCEKRQEITPRVTHWMPLPQPPKEG